MTDVDVDAELAALRARAYGADADIHDDPVALARLRDLEERRRIMGEAAVAPSAPAAPAVAPPPSAFVFASLVAGTDARPDAGHTPDHTLDPGRDRAADPAADPAVAPAASDTAPRSRGRLLLACAVTALATAAVTAGITLWATSAGADRPDAVVRPAVDPTPNETLDDQVTDIVQFDDFHGMQVAAGTLSEDRTQRCVFITIPQGQFSSGTGACAIAPFDPQLDLALATYAGSEIADAFGADAVLRLRVVGDELRVFVAHEPAGTGA
ncbi:hypothetical protein [Microbacterium aurum]|jgi:hypothetical protein|uniref:hypothetical protein n=1 Tax=Microbacterium aurum TaxID=36805 RepID=UPI00248DD3A9|nr:hypothetical protein [Microbacterium aurum]